MFRTGALYMHLFRQCRHLCTPSASGVPERALPGAGIVPPPRPAYQTHRIPVYTLPYYGAAESTLANLSDEDVSRALKAYGGLLRKKDTLEERRERLERLTRDRLTITGVVVSDKMDKSVVIAAHRPKLAKKLRRAYAVTRRFMAHDEQGLCREGDLVTIRSCRPLSRWKSHVVVKNFGDKTLIGSDNRGKALEAAIAATKVPVPDA